MLGLESGHRESWLGSSGDDWSERVGLARRRDTGGPSRAC